jgi:hypothetical protein
MAADAITPSVAADSSIDRAGDRRPQGVGILDTPSGMQRLAVQPLAISPAFNGFWRFGVSLEYLWVSIQKSDSFSAVPGRTSTRRETMRKTIMVGFMVAAALWSPVRSDAVFVFTENFDDGTIDPAITSPSALDVDTSPSGEQFLGLLDASERGLSNTTVNLAVNSGPYTQAVLGFSLYIIATMDGSETFTLADNSGTLFTLVCNNIIPTAECNAPQNVSPDVSGLTITPVAPTTLFTDTNPGAVDEAAYLVSLMINRSSSALSFSYSSLQDINDESWGLDNIALTTNTLQNGVVVPSVPEPGTLSLLALGLLGFGGLAVRRLRG